MHAGRIAVVIGLLGLAACASGGGASSAQPPAPVTSSPSGQPLPSGPPPTSATGIPRPDHVVVVVMENHAYSGILGSGSAPYLTGLAARGASFTQSFAVAHPSQPNYLALFSGSAQGITDDSCPHTFSGPNLGQELIAAGKSFAGFSESMPSDGYTGCSSGDYARKHNPWVNFTTVPPSSNLTFNRFPGDYAQLPTVSFVIPNLCDDMHNCPVATGDTWLRDHIDGYARWARTHKSLLVVTWDEDDNGHDNRIPTIVVGDGVKIGTFSEKISHYNVLRTIEDMYRLPHAGASASATPITDIWQ
ncbi:MAG: alkaline phosphatase family protein [Frankia sp.]